MTKYITDPTTGQRLKIQKSHKFRNFVLLPFLGFVGLIVVIAVATSHGGSATGPAGVGGHTVHYEVSGEGTGLVTYAADAHMGMAQNNGAALPWSKDVTMDQGFAPVALSVQHSSGSGPVSCKIVMDGKTVANNTATGAYAVATCNGTAQ